MQNESELFRTVVEIDAAALALPLSARFLVLGSCFAENLGDKLQAADLRCLCNPYGIVYHPLAMARGLQRLLAPAPFQPDELLAHDGLWCSLDHHGQFSDASRETCLERINAALTTGAEALRQADLLVLTFGTAFAYYHRQRDQIVANCHRLPPADFERRLIAAEQMAAIWRPLLSAVRSARPELEVVITVSPVRHWRDNPEANQLSKAHLLILAHELTELGEWVRYFPAYELLLDELRDYRFYADDMQHPSAAAIDYIWRRFARWAFAAEIGDYLAQLAAIRRRQAHRPRQPDSEAHRQFVAETERLRQAFRAQYPGHGQ